MLAQSNRAVNPDPHDTQGLRLLDDVVALQHHAQIHRHGLGSREHSARRADRGVDKVGDHRQVQDVDTPAHHGHASGPDMRDAHQAECHFLHERGLRHHLEPQPDRPDHLDQFDKHRERNPEEAPASQVEDKLHVHVTGFGGGGLRTWFGVVRKRRFEVVVAPAFLEGCSFLGVFLFVFLVDVLFEAIDMVVGERAHAQDSQRVAPLVDLGNAHVFNDTWRRGLHDILDGIANWRQHFWVEESPEDTKEAVHPFDGFGEEICRRRLSSKLLTAPFQFTTTANDLLHPKPYTGGDARCQRNQSPQRTAENSTDKEGSKGESHTQPYRTLLERLVHGLKGDGPCTLR